MGVDVIFEGTGSRLSHQLPFFSYTPLPYWVPALELDLYIGCVSVCVCQSVTVYLCVS